MAGLAGDSATSVGGNATSYTAVTGISVAKPAGATTAVITLSANISNAGGSFSTNSCTLAFQGPGQTAVATSDTYNMTTNIGGNTESVNRTFYLTGLASAAGTYTLYYKGGSSSNSRSCTISEVSFVLLTP